MNPSGQSHQPSSRHLTLPCAQCGRAAAEIALLPPIPDGRDLWHDRERLERTEFLGTTTLFGRTEFLVDLFEAIQRGDYETARNLDPDMVSFICEACGQVYCDTCWQVDPPVFDEDFRESTYAMCPCGHKQLVDD